MSCGCDRGKGQRPSWSQTTVDAGVTSCGGPGPLGQPGRAPASMVGCASCARGAPWWLWLLVALVAWRLLKGGG
jgi:hypothetical protein